jgi:hypothetical protein
MVGDLVTAEEVRFQCRIDPPDSNYEDPNEAWINLWITVVSQSVASWLKDEWRIFLPLLDSNDEIIRDSNDNPIQSDVVNPIVRGAVLVEIASQFRFREGEGDNRVESHEGHGYVLSKTATAMLAPLRKTTLA